MLDRIKKSLIGILVSIDQFIQILIFTPIYIIFGGSKPNPDETLSSKIGKNAILGKKWALRCEYLVDAIFRLVTGEINHCRNKIEKEEI